jgi:hypothetical protein
MAANRSRASTSAGISSTSRCTTTVSMRASLKAWPSGRHRDRRSARRLGLRPKSVPGFYGEPPIGRPYFSGYAFAASVLGDGTLTSARTNENSSLKPGLTRKSKSQTGHSSICITSPRRPITKPIFAARPRPMAFGIVATIPARLAARRHLHTILSLVRLLLSTERARPMACG